MKHLPSYPYERVREIVDQAYRASTAPGEWPRFSELLARSIGGNISSIHFQDLENQSGSVACHWGIEEEFQRVHDT